MSMWSELTRQIVDRPGMATDGRLWGPSHVRVERVRKRRRIPPLLTPDKVDTSCCTEDGNPWRLTGQRVAVINLLVQGLDRSAIARRLGIEGHTVSQYLLRLRTQIGVTSTTKAVIAWHRHYETFGPLPTVPEGTDDRLVERLRRATLYG